MRTYFSFIDKINTTRKYCQAWTMRHIALRLHLIAHIRLREKNKKYQNKNEKIEEN